MRLEELAKELRYGTTIQKEERAKGLLGTEVEITSTISDVAKNSIRLNFILSDANYDIRASSVTVDFDEKEFGRQLLSYSHGEDVKLIGRLKKVTFGFKGEILSPYLAFDLISISKIGTTYKSRKEAKETEAAKQGCFIATVCYGDISSPEVLLLRRFREDILMRSGAGRTLVRGYYRVSPPLARALAHRPLLRKWIRRYGLEPTVVILRWWDRRTAG